jgi:hypothetical protein
MVGVVCRLVDEDPDVVSEESVDVEPEVVPDVGPEPESALSEPVVAVEPSCPE